MQRTRETRGPYSMISCTVAYKRTGFRKSANRTTPSTPHRRRSMRHATVVAASQRHSVNDVAACRFQRPSEKKTRTHSARDVARGRRDDRDRRRSTLAVPRASTSIYASVRVDARALVSESIQKLEKSAVRSPDDLPVRDLDGRIHRNGG